ncbi:hypothetical protein [Lentzea sp. HUAS12]|uniref:hypothetical protein n=1 Tax=Lentzea sp. HUAS12 TaxID=2951806 RepID=UPI00209C9F46|nr:hypothetical protein [Lentzea sp. HUAS12]USX56417.1 hypothetical protein ND450_20640 [Lentzea sp. HUAS12]
MNVEPLATSDVRGSLVGEHFNDTAVLSLEDIAERLGNSLLNAQEDGLLPPEAAFSITADDSGETPVLRVIAQCDSHADDFINVGDKVPLSAPGIAQAVFQLASVYNSVDLDRPGRARFQQEIQVRCGEWSSVMVGVMEKIRKR